MNNTEWINKNKIVIVGLGLMGGSYAKALTRMGFNVYGIDKNRNSIDFAISNGIIKDGTTVESEKFLADADCIILGLYPGIVKKWVQDHQRFFKPGIRITDVTGVKSSVVYDVQNILRDDVEFIASHPMAGREVYGVENCDDMMFRGANFIVVPTEKNTQDAIEWCMNLGRILGFNRISLLSPEEHDEMIAYVSQLTHCIAVSLMTCNDNPNIRDYTGDSFRDLTRIARINEEMWTELFHMNKNALLKEMNIFMNEFNDLKSMIENDDFEGIKKKMRLSTERRMKFNK